MRPFIILSALWIVFATSAVIFVCSHEKQNHHLEFEPYSQAWLVMDITYYGKSFPSEQAKQTFNHEIKNIVWFLNEDPYLVGQGIKKLFKSHGVNPIWINTDIAIKAGKITMTKETFRPMGQDIAIFSLAISGLSLALYWITNVIMWSVFTIKRWTFLQKKK